MLVRSRWVGQHGASQLGNKVGRFRTPFQCIGTHQTIHHAGCGIQRCQGKPAGILLRRGHELGAAFRRYTQILQPHGQWLNEAIAPGPSAPAFQWHRVGVDVEIIEQRLSP